TVMKISLESFVNNFPLIASCLPLRCWMFFHFECPATAVHPHFYIYVLYCPLFLYPTLVGMITHQDKSTCHSTLNTLQFAISSDVFQHFLIDRNNELHWACR